MPKSNERPKIIYLDYAASVSPNPSSIHALGVEAKRKLEKARKDVAGFLGARREEIIFTSGGTESNNLAILGLVYPYPTSPYSRGRSKEGVKIPHIVTTNIEHPSVFETCKQRGNVTFVEVEKNGVVDPQKIKKSLRSDTVLVSVMYANNEIGTIQPIKEIAKEIRHYNKLNKKEKQQKIIFHTDAVQAVNYLDLNVEKLGVDMLSLSGSKIEGSGRVGVLFRKKSVPLKPIMRGGDQEGGLRPGTSNLPEILKFSSALTLMKKSKDKETKRLTKLRDYFCRGLDTRLSGVQHPTHLINGDLENRLPNNVSVTFPKIPSDLLVIELSARGIMCSSKSACKSSKAEGSYVIKAINPKLDPEIGALRFSFGKSTTKADIDYTVRALSEILTKLKKWYN